MTIDAINAVMVANVKELPPSLSEKRKAAYREDGLTGKNTSFFDTVSEVSRVGKVETPSGTGDGSSEGDAAGSDHGSALPVRNMAMAELTAAMIPARVRFADAAAYEPSDTPYLRSLALSMYNGTFSYAE